MPQRVRRMSGHALPVLLALGSCLACLGCADQKIPGPVDMDAQETERWEISLVEWRIEKNEDFMDRQRSPLPADLMEEFEGLDYYFPEPSFRYQVPLEVAAAADTVRLQTSQGGTADYLVKGTVRFRHGRQVHALTVLAPLPGAQKLWLPFFDQTNGTTTYPGGRYLDLELAADGTVEIDFNKAYSPLCAYDPERWNCAQPPPQNTLALPVVAGEKLLVGAHP